MTGQGQEELTDGWGWYLAQCKPNAERIALSNLDNQDFKTFLPLQEITQRKATLFQKKMRPLFPGYIFIRLNINDGFWRKVNSTRGVARLVRFGKDPSPVPDGVVEGLIAHCSPEGVLQGLGKLKPGDQVQITQGPFAGFLAQISDVKPDRRVHLLLEIMGQKSAMTISQEAVVAL